MATHSDKKPSEHEYRDYRNSIETAAEAIEDELEDDEEHEGIHHAVHETADSSRWVMMNGYNQMAVLLSEQNPDSPEYCEPWHVYADLTDDRPTASEVLNAMAFVCVYSDIYGLLKRRGNIEDI